MRWYCIDRIIAFQAGTAASAVKVVSAGQWHDHYPGYPVMPGSMIIEGMGQTAMLLVCEAIQYTEMVLLAKVAKATFYFDALAGDTLTYTVTISSITQNGVLAHGCSRRGAELQGEAELLFTRLANERAAAWGDDVRHWARPLFPRELSPSATA